jgi:hypothetical protein
MMTDVKGWRTRRIRMTRRIRIRIKIKDVEAMPQGLIISR